MVMALSVWFVVCFTSMRMITTMLDPPQTQFLFGCPLLHSLFARFSPGRFSKGMPAYKFCRLLVWCGFVNKRLSLGEAEVIYINTLFSPYSLMPSPFLPLPLLRCSFYSVSP